MVSSVREILKIVLFCVGAAVGYGVALELATISLSFAYFSLMHPPLIAGGSPVLLALAWGVVATWWLGLAFGLVLAAAARLGRKHQLGLRDLRPSILFLVVIVACAALLAAAAGAVLTATGVMRPTPARTAQLPEEGWTTFMAAAWAHLASYASGIIGGLTVIAYVMWRRLFLWRYELSTSGYSRST